MVMLAAEFFGEFTARLCKSFKAAVLELARLSHYIKKVGVAEVEEFIELFLVSGNVGHVHVVEISVCGGGQKAGSVILVFCCRKATVLSEG